MFGLILTTLLAAPIVPPESQILGSLAAAKTYDYCAWAHDEGADRQLLPDVSVYLESDQRGSDRHFLPSAIVIDAGMRIAADSQDKPVCEEILSAGRALTASVRKRNASGVRKQSKFKISRDKSIAAVQSEISSLWTEDQLARLSYIQTQTSSRADARHWAHSIATADAVAVDEKSARYLQLLMAEYGWLDTHRFGRRTSQQAWTLVQHSDAHRDLQRLALSRMESYLATGGVLKKNYAYLWDRVAVNSGEPQRYGTQPDWSSCEGGMLSLMPMEDPLNVDERRATMNLGPLQSDLEQMSQQTCAVAP